MNLDITYSVAEIGRRRSSVGQFFPPYGDPYYSGFCALKRSKYHQKGKTYNDKCDIKCQHCEPDPNGGYRCKIGMMTRREPKDGKNRKT